MKAKPGFNIRNVCGQDLIVAEGEENIDFSNIISMNETSSYLWKKVQKMDSFTADVMADLLTQEYDVDKPTALADCEKLAAQWAKAGIIEGDDIPDIDIQPMDEGVKEPGDVMDNVQVGEPLEDHLPQKKGFFNRLLHKKH